MIKTTPEQNKTLVLQAFDTLFNMRDYKAAERYWSSNYIQHSAHIAPGRDGLFNLVRSMPAALKYEPGLIVAENDYVIVHGRFSGTGRPRNWIAADVVRVADGIRHGRRTATGPARVPSLSRSAKGNGRSGDCCPARSRHPDQDSYWRQSCRHAEGLPRRRSLHRHSGLGKR